MFLTSEENQYRNENVNDDYQRMNKRILTLPRIEHPSKRINQDLINSLDIRGKSSTGNGNGSLIRNESAFDRFSSYSNTRRDRRRSSLSTTCSSFSNRPDQKTNSVRLPIFGKKKIQ